MPAVSSNSQKCGDWAHKGGHGDWFVLPVGDLAISVSIKWWTPISEQKS
jgi:hypothetical protein